MPRRFGLSTVIVTLLTLLVTVIATADFSAVGTEGTGGARPVDGLGRGRPAEPRPLPDAVKEVVSPGSARTLRLSDSSLELDIPDGISDAALEISIEPQRAPGGGGVKIFQQWDLRATDVVSAAELHQFAKEITLRSVFNSDDIRGMDWNSLSFVWFNTETSSWDPIPTEVDFESQTMTAKTDHFSIYGSQASSAYALPGQIMDHQVNLNSGAATYSYPLQLPPGRGGFQPLDLSFNYNSGSVDEMKNKRDIGSVAGIGWSFGLPSIFYNEEKDEYSLVLGGVSGDLVYSGTGTRWHTNPDQGIYVERTESGSDKWEVRTPTGTLYTFDTQRKYWPAPCTGSATTYRWDLDSIVDLRGNTIEITWAQDLLEHSEGSCESVRSAYPTAITAVDGMTDLWVVDFDYRVSTDSVYVDSNYSGTGDRIRKDVPRHTTSRPEPIIVETRVLDAVVIEDDADNIIRKYVLGTTTSDAVYNASYVEWYAGLHKLDSITVHGSGSTAGTLPALNFTYTDLELYIRATLPVPSGGNPGNPFEVDRPYLTKVTNGYGASIAFDFEQRPARPVFDAWTRQIVTRVTADPDTNTETDGVPIVTDYAYIDDSGKDADPIYVGSTDELWFMDFRGFDLVKVTGGDGSYSLNRFFTDGSSVGVSHPIAGSVTEDAEKFRGRSYEQEVFAANDIRVSRTITNWDWSWVVSAEGIYKSYVGDSGSQTFDADGSTENSKSWTYFGYDSYGNLNLERRLGNYAVNNDDVTIHRDYVYNTSATKWIVNTVKNERLYTGNIPTDPEDSPDNVAEVKIGETRYSYDEMAYGATNPTRGETTQVDVYSSPTKFDRTIYEYDDTQFGNVTELTDPAGNTSIFDYDTLLHAFVTTTTYPAVDPDSSMTVQSTYDLLPDTGSPNLPAGILRGLKDSDTDENGNVTSYAYDFFGRITEVTRPEDGSYPSQKYSYENWGTIGDQRIEIEAKVNESPLTYLMRQEYFDGFGRIAQIHEPSGTPGDIIVTQTTIYDNSGRIANQYTPWEVTPVYPAVSLDAYQTPLDSQATNTSEQSAGKAINVDINGISWINPENVDASDDSRSTFTGTGLAAASTGWKSGHDTKSVDYQEGASIAGDGVLNYDLGYASSTVPTIWNPLPENPWSDHFIIGFQDFELPFDTDIKGFETRIRYKQLFYVSTMNAGVSMSKSDAPVGTGKTIASDFPTSWTTATKGSSSDLWGTTWQASDLEASGFGAVLLVNSGLNTGNSWTYALFDYVELNVHYEAPVVSDGLDVSGFGLDIPAGAHIDGIEVKIERSGETATEDVRDEVIQLLSPNGPIGENKADTITAWPTTDTVKTYPTTGGSTDTWGRDWTAAEVNSPDFGVRVQVRTKSTDDARVDHVQIKVYYTEPLADVFSPSTVYDALGRVITQTGVDGSTVTRSYAPATSSGEVWAETVTDAEDFAANPQRITSKNYTDAFARLVRIEELNDSAVVYRETRYTYDASGNLTKVEVDPIIESSLPTVVTEMTYDWLGRKLTHRDPDVGFWQYSYDTNGNLATQTDARGVEITFTYDELNRETVRQCTANCPEGTAPIILAEFFYDDDASGNNGKGRRTSAFNGNDTGSYTVADSYYYDARGRLTQQTRELDSTDYVTGFTYDPSDRLLTTTLPSGEVVAQDYDARSLPGTLTSSVIGDVVSSSTYNILDLPTAVNLGNGTINKRKYFGLEYQAGNTEHFGQLYQILDDKSSTAFVNLTYDWDLNGNLTSRTDEIASGGPKEETFTYDFLNRLTSAYSPYASYEQAAAPTPDHSYPMESITSDVVADAAGSLDGTALPASPNGPSITTGVEGNGLDFDGTDDNVELPYTVLDGLTDFTVAVWFKTADTGVQTLLSGANSTNAEEFLLRLISNTSLQLRADGHQLDWSSLPSMADNAWHHLALTYDDVNGEVSVYLDATKLKVTSTTASTIDVDTGGLFIGQKQSSVGSGFSEHYDGVLDEVRIFNSVLNSYEIALSAGLADAYARWELDETTGTTASDSIGSLDGTLTNGPVWNSSGHFNGALTFDGDNDYVSLPNTALSGAKSSSVSLWFKTSQTGNQGMVTGSRSSNTNEYRLLFQSDTSFDFLFNWQTASWTGLTSIADNQWHHLVLSRDATDLEATLYIDGVSQGTKSLSTSSAISIDSGGLIVGQEQDSVGGGFDPNEAFDGVLDDLRIFRRAIAQDEVDDLFGGLGGPASATYDYTYDGHDNITLKRGQGEYVYDVGAGSAPLISAPTIAESASTDHYWSFNSADITGDTVDDLLGTADGTLVPNASTGPQVVSGLFGDALDFDGNNTDYVSLPNTVVDGKTDLTLSFWIKTSKTGDQGLISGASAGSYNNLLVFLDSGTHLKFYADTEIAEWDSITSVADNFWHHVAVVRDDANDQVTLYLDGIPQGTVSLTMGAVDVEATGFLIGQEQDSVGGGLDPAQAFDGLMDDLRIYDRVLTSGEVTAVYYTATTPARPHLVTGTLLPVAPDLTPALIIPAAALAGDEIHAVAIDGDTLVVAAPKDDGAAQDAGIAYVYRRNSGTGNWDLEGTLTISNANANDMPGELNGSVSIDGDTIVIGARRDDASGVDSGAVHVFTRSGTTWTQQGSALLAETPAAGEFFGSWVEIDKDRLVAASTADNGSKGSITSFTRSGTTWTLEDTLTETDISAGQTYGVSVALEGTTLAVGASGDDDNSLTDSGSVFIYELVAGLWEFQEKLHASDPEANAYFGVRVALSGGHLLVGARGDDAEATDSGAAYLFRKGANGNWVQAQKITGSDLVHGSNFGVAVDIDGDMLIVGADYHDGAENDTGGAYLFRLEGDTWVEHAALTGDSGATGDRFGYSVSIHGEHVVIGAKLRHNGATADTGAFAVAKVRTEKTYTYDANGNTTSRPGQDLVWNSQNTLEEVEDSSTSNTIESYLYDADGQRAIKTAANDDVTHYASGQYQVEIPTSGNSTATTTYFHGGQVVASQTSTPVDPDLTPALIIPAAAVAGDEVHASAIDGDTLVIGAPYDDGAAQDAGIAYVYRLNQSTGQWNLESSLVTTDALTGDLIGVAHNTMTIDGDTIAIGVYNEHSTGVRSGATYVFTRTGTTWSQQAKIVAPTPVAYEDFGWSVDLDGDRLAIGVRGNGTNGAVYVSTRTGTSWSSPVTIPTQEGGSSNGFGASVALEGDALIVGAPYANHTYTLAGAAYVYELVGSTWTYRQKLIASVPEYWAAFGASVALSGGNLIVGAHYNPAVSSTPGAIYAFRKDGSGSWKQTQKITPAGVVAADWLGGGTSIDGDIFIVGVSPADGSATDTGEAYVYRLDGDTWVQHAKLTGESEAASDLFGHSVDVQGEWAVISVRKRDNGATLDTGAFAVVKVREQNVQFLHPDHLGSPVAATDVFGDVVGTQSFYPFGEIRAGTGIFDTERGFTGQIFDDGTGLGFYNARYQDPALGRFISPDSIVPNPRAPSNFNRYSYVLNSPLVYTDPSGHCYFNMPCPKPVKDAIDLVADLAEDVNEVAKTTSRNVSRATAAAQDVPGDFWSQLWTTHILNPATGDWVTIHAEPSIAVSAEATLGYGASSSSLRLELLHTRQDGFHLEADLDPRFGRQPNKPADFKLKGAISITNAQTNEEYQAQTEVQDHGLFQFRSDPDDPSNYGISFGIDIFKWKKNTTPKPSKRSANIDAYWNLELAT